MNKPIFNTPQEALRYHVTGAIERGEGEPIAGIPARPELPRLGKRESKHLYRVEILTPAGRNEVDIDANTRNQAGAIAKRAGYTVCSVNMIG